MLQSNLLYLKSVFQSFGLRASKSKSDKKRDVFTFLLDMWRTPETRDCSPATLKDLEQNTREAFEVNLAGTESDKKSAVWH